MKTEYAPMDISSHLDNEEVIAEYLTAAAEDENPDVLLLALADVAKARGMAQVAKDAGLGRESLYKALAPGSHPRFATIQAVLRALGVKVAVRRPETAKSKPRTVSSIEAFRKLSEPSQAGEVVVRRGMAKAEPKTVTIDAFVPSSKAAAARAAKKASGVANVYIEARPKGRREGEPIENYVVEDHADHILKTFKTQHEAIEWAKKEGHHPLVARVRHVNDKKVRHVNDKKNADHWRAA
jgi:probable addiction module antidote protein